MIRSKIQTTTKGGEDVSLFLKEIRKYKHAFVTIGVHEGAGSYEGTNAPSVVEVALWTEYGTKPHGNHPGTPAYHWMSKAIDEKASLLNTWREEMIRNIVNKGWSVKKALEAMGFRIQTLLQNKIKSNMEPHNRPSTIAQKERDGVPPVTLIHTGLLLRSVTYRVHLE